MTLGDLLNPVTVSLAIFVVAYILLSLDKIHRTIISLAGATAMVFAGKFLGFSDIDP